MIAILLAVGLNGPEYKPYQLVYWFIWPQYRNMCWIFDSLNWDQMFNLLQRHTHIIHTHTHAHTQITRTQRRTKTQSTCAHTLTLIAYWTYQLFEWLYCHRKMQERAEVSDTTHAQWAVMSNLMNACSRWSFHFFMSGRERSRPLVGVWAQERSRAFVSKSTYDHSQKNSLWAVQKSLMDGPRLLIRACGIINFRPSEIWVSSVFYVVIIHFVLLQWAK